MRAARRRGRLAALTTHQSRSGIMSVRTTVCPSTVALMVALEVSSAAAGFDRISRA